MKYPEKHGLSIKVNHILLIIIVNFIKNIYLKNILLENMKLQQKTR